MAMANTKMKEFVSAEGADNTGPPLRRLSVIGQRRSGRFRDSEISRAAGKEKQAEEREEKGKGRQKKTGGQVGRGAKFWLKRRCFVCLSSYSALLRCLLDFALHISWTTRFSLRVI